MQFTFIKNIYISIFFIMKILTDFRKIVETGSAPEGQETTQFFGDTMFLNLKGRLVPTLSGLISLMRPRSHGSNQI